MHRGFHGTLWLGLLLAAPSIAQHSPVSFEQGDLPIILSAPHGGQQPIPGVPIRKGVGVKQFVTRADAYTATLAEHLADAIEQRLGKRPYVVIARFHRKYIDANRPAERAYEVEQAKTAYKAYHRALAKACNEVGKRWDHGLLLDLHGQAANPLAIYRGTQNGQTTRQLVKRFGVQALSGERSLFGQLAKQGFEVVPAIGSTRQEDKYAGGYIVKTYGRAQGGTVDAIQVELGRKLREPEANPATAEKMAAAIAAYAKQHLPINQASPVAP